MYYTSPTSNITPALVSVAMSRSDSRDSTCSTTSSTGGFSAAPLNVSYATSPMSRTISNTSSSASSVSLRRASQVTQRRDSTANWISSPYRSCQQLYEEPSSFLSDDELLWIAPSKASPPLPINSIPGPDAARRRSSLTTEEQIAMLREQQEKGQQDELVRQQQQQRRQAAAQQKAVRFAPQQQRRPSALKKRSPVIVKKASN